MRIKLVVNFNLKYERVLYLNFRSPYLCTMKKHFTIPIFVPELACPHRCLFCNQNHITSREHVPGMEETKDIIERHLKTLPVDAKVDIGYLGGNFTGIPVRQQEAFLELASGYKKSGRVQGIRVSTRPDYIDETVLNRLGRFGVTTIELGAQSMDDTVLRKAGRGHSVKDTKRASVMIVEKNFHLGLQMMIGLPDDNDEKSLHTARRIVELGATSTRIYPTLVVRNTPLEEMWRNGKYQPLTMKQAIGRTRKLVPVFEEGNVKIIRIGLHPSEGFLDGSQLLAGPFHQSFRELVMTEVWNERLKNHQWNKEKNQVTLRVNPHEFNTAVGYQAKNKKMLLDTFQQVKFIRDKTVAKGAFYADYC